MPIVSVVRAESDVTAAFGEAMTLAGLGGIVSPGDRVLVKPNQHGGKGVTSPRVIAAAARWAFAQGAAEVWVGDGPFWGMIEAEPYFAESGLQAACDETGARALNFHKGPYRLFTPGSPDLPQTIGFSQYLYDAEVVINLPLMKTHFNTLVTMGIKNLKGCLRPGDKKALHEMELNAALAEVNRLLKPTITATVLDATTAMEGMGPSAATPVELGLLVAGSDVVAVDSVGCDLMGIDPRQARLIRYCAERGVGEADLARITVVGERVADHRRRFQLPFEAMAQNFPDLVLHTAHACSGCALNLFRAMEISRQHGQPLICRTVVIGPEVKTEAQTLLVGQCTRAGWGQAPHVAGCPPRVEDIRVGLTGIETSDSVPQS